MVKETLLVSSVMQSSWIRETQNLKSDFPKSHQKPNVKFEEVKSLLVGVTCLSLIDRALRYSKTVAVDFLTICLVF